MSRVARRTAIKYIQGEDAQNALGGSFVVQHAATSNTLHTIIYCWDAAVSWQLKLVGLLRSINQVNADDTVAIVAEIASSLESGARAEWVLTEGILDGYNELSLAVASSLDYTASCRCFYQNSLRRTNQEPEPVRFPPHLPMNLNLQPWMELYTKSRVMISSVFYIVPCGRRNVFGVRTFLPSCLLSFLPQISGIGVMSANMVLNANTLVAGSHYTFSLTAVYLDDGRRLQEDESSGSSASISFSVNVPPTGGSFEVSPDAGEQAEEKPHPNSDR